MLRFFNYKIFILMALLFGCGVDEDPTELDIVGGEIASSPAPAIGLLIKSKSLGSEAFFTKTCTAARIQYNLFLTSAQCLAQNSRNQEDIIIVRSASGKMHRGLSFDKVNIHPRYDSVIDDPKSPHNVGVFSLKGALESLEGDVPIGSLGWQKPSVDAKVTTYGAGCDKAASDGTCQSQHTILRHLKVLSTTVVEPSQAPVSERFFYTKRADGYHADGDVGGPVFNESGEIIGVNSYTSVGFDRLPTYLSLAHPEITAFLGNEPLNPGDQVIGLVAEAQAAIVEIEEAIEFTENCPVSDLIIPPVVSNQPVSSSVLLDGSTVSMSREANAEANCPKFTSGQKDVRLKVLRTALGLAQQAELAARAGDEQAARELLDAAKSLLAFGLDIGVGFTPLGKFKDLAECLTGYALDTKELLSGQLAYTKLDGSDQAFACIGLISVNSKVAKAVAEFAEKTPVWRKVVSFYGTFKDYFAKQSERLRKILRVGSKLEPENVREALVEAKTLLKSNSKFGDAYSDELVARLLESASDSGASADEVLDAVEAIVRQAEKSGALTGKGLERFLSRTTPSPDGGSLRSLVGESNDLSKYSLDEILSKDSLRGIYRENQSAEALSDFGFQVTHYNDSSAHPLYDIGKFPDFLVNGKYFDCFSPTSAKARNIADAMQKKVDDQADSIILNLTDSDVSIEANSRFSNRRFG